MADQYADLGFSPHAHADLGFTPEAAVPAQPAPQKGFLDSYLDNIKGFFTGIASDLRPKSRQERVAAAQHAVDVADKYVHGTAEEHAAARDEMIGAFPGGSTALKVREGNYAGAGGDLAAMATLAAAAHGITKGPAILDSAKSGIRAVSEGLAKPGTGQIAVGGGQLASAPGALYAGHPVVAGGLAVRGLQNLKAGLAARAAVPAVVASELEEGLAQANTGKAFAKLTPTEQAAIRAVADRIQNGVVDTPAPVGPRPPIELGEPIVGKPLDQMVREHVESMRPPPPPDEPMPMVDSEPPTMDRLRNIRDIADRRGYPPPYTPESTEPVGPGAPFPGDRGASPPPPPAAEAAPGPAPHPKAAANRAAMAQALAKSTFEHVPDVDPAEIPQAHWDSLARALGYDKAPSKATTAQAIFEYRKLGGAPATPVEVPANPVSTPKPGMVITEVPAGMNPTTAALARQLAESMSKPEASQFVRDVNEPGVLARSFIEPLVKQGVFDDSGARTMEMAIRRMVLSEREAAEVVSRAKGEGPITGQRVADAVRSLSEGNPDFGEKGMEFGTNRIAAESDRFQRQVDARRAATAKPESAPAPKATEEPAPKPKRRSPKS